MNKINGGKEQFMEFVRAALTAIHLLAVIAWLGGMIFHIVVLDPVFRKNEVSIQSAFLLALMEGRFRKLVGTSIALLLTSGAAKAYFLLGSADALLHTAAGRYVLLKLGLTAAMLVIFAVCPKTKSCSPIPGVCDVAGGGILSGKMDGTIRERSKVILPKVALGFGLSALVAAVLLRG
jgi:uncharacterized membrane protein